MYRPYNSVRTNVLHCENFFLRPAAGLQTLQPILTGDDSIDAKSRKDVPFGVTKIEDDI